MHSQSSATSQMCISPHDKSLGEPLLVACSGLCVPLPKCQLLSQAAGGVPERSKSITENCDEGFSAYIFGLFESKINENLTFAFKNTAWLSRL